MILDIFPGIEHPWSQLIWQGSNTKSPACTFFMSLLSMSYGTWSHQTAVLIITFASAFLQTCVQISDLFIALHILSCLTDDTCLLCTWSCRLHVCFLLATCHLHACYMPVTCLLHACCCVGSGAGRACTAAACKEEGIGAARCSNATAG